MEKRPHGDSRVSVLVRVRDGDGGAWRKRVLQGMGSAFGLSDM